MFMSFNYQSKVSTKAYIIRDDGVNLSKYISIDNIHDMIEIIILYNITFKV